jgi:YggT family protein
VLTFHGGNPLYDLGQLYLLLLLIRAVMSWFPYNPDSPLSPVFRFVVKVTEPVLAPFRRIIPPIGMFDISFMVAVIVVWLIVQNVLVHFPG